MIQSIFFYSIQASRATKIITPSDPTRETDHVDHDLYYVLSDRESNKPHAEYELEITAHTKRMPQKTHPKQNAYDRQK